MCVLQPCANPTQVGVWWRDDAQWCRYQAANERLIRTSVRQNLRSIDLGSITSAVHPQGWRYTADLQSMEQIALSTGQRRAIVIIDPPAAPPAQLPPPAVARRIAGSPRHNNVVPTVYYRDSSGQLHPYDPILSRPLLEAVVAGNQTQLMLRDQRQGKYLLFDLQTMKQRVVVGEADGEHVVVSNDAPVDVIIEVPWSPAAMGAIAKKGGQDVRRKVLEMAIQRHLSDQHRAVPPAKSEAQPRIMGPETLKPGHPTYETLLDCLDNLIGQSEDGLSLLSCAEEFMKRTDSTTSPSGKSILKLACKLVQSGEVVNGNFKAMAA